MLACGAPNQNLKSWNRDSGLRSSNLQSRELVLSSGGLQVAYNMIIEHGLLWGIIHVVRCVLLLDVGVCVCGIVIVVI